MFVFPFCDVVWAKIAHCAEGATFGGDGLELEFECPAIDLKNGISAVANAIRRSFEIEQVYYSVFTGVVLRWHLNREYTHSQSCPERLRHKPRHKGRLAISILAINY